MRNIAELKDQANVLIEENKVLLDKAQREGRELTPAELQKFDDNMLSINKRKKDIEEETKRQANILGNTGSGPRFMMGDGDNTTIKRGEDDMSGITILKPEQRFADHVRTELPDGIKREELSVGRLLRAKITGDWHDAQAERRAILSEGQDIYGGFLLPEIMSAEIIDLSRAAMVVNAAGARTVPMDNATLTIPRRLTDPTVFWKGELQEATASDLTFGKFVMNARTLVGLIKVSQELVEDSPNLESYINEAISTALAMEVDRVCIRGTGVGNEPCGIRNWTGIQTRLIETSGRSLQVDDITDAVFDIGGENGPITGLSAVYSTRTAKAIDKLKSGEGVPIFPSLIPESVKNLKRLVSNVVLNSYTQGTTTTCSEMYIGNFPDLLIGMRKNITLAISNQASDSDSNAFKNLEIWIRAYLRMDTCITKEKNFNIIQGIL